MSQRSDISASIQQNFPDNSAQFITPTRLRSEQGLFEQYSVLNEQTASIIAQAVASSSASPINTGSLVTTASFNAYTASTNTFTGSIQTQVNALQAATGSYITNAQTSSMSVLSASYASSSTSASYALTASFALNAGGTIDTGSFATTGSNTFNGTNTFTGSLNAESASITFLTVGTIVSSSTIFSSGSNTLGDAANDVQTLFGTVDIKTGPLKVSGSADISGSLTVNGNSVVLSSQTSSFVQNSQTSSFVTNAQTGSFVTSAITGSSLITASVALNTITFAKGDGSTFPITVNTGSGGSAFPFTGSAQISGSLVIDNNTDSEVFSLKQTAYTTESLYSITMGYQADVTESLAVGGNLLLSGSFNNTYRIVIPTTIDNLTGSLLGTASYATTAGNGMNLGANVFTGSQTLSSSTTPASLLLNVSGALSSFVTESRSTTTGFGNIIFNGRTGATLSGSVVVSGSGNIVYYSGISATANGGFIGNNNLGVVPTYSGSVPNYNFNVAPSTFIVSASTPITIASNWIAGASPTYITNTTATSSFSFNVVNGAGIRISASLSGSSTGNSVGINSNNLGGANHLIHFEGSSSVTRNFLQNTILGTNNTASLTSVSGASITTGSLLNTTILGSNLIVSGTMSSTSLSASVFVGKYNSTASFYPNISASLADPTQVVFGVGSGTSNTARKTSLYVSASGLTVITDNAWVSGTLTIEQDTDTVALQLTQKTVGASTWQIIQGGSVNTSTNIATNATHTFTGGGANTYSFLTPVIMSSSVALTVTGSTNLTGSLRVNGNLQYNYGEFWMSSSQTPSAGVSQSVVFDSTGHSVGVAISGSGDLIKVTNGGTYNIQFSAQINCSAGADTMWMWFKKNGTNIAASNSKAVLANNTAQLITVNILDTATANDYYEIAYQNNAGNAQILSEAASGNYPSIPGVILTVTQVA